MSEERKKILREEGVIVLCGETDTANIKSAISDIVCMNLLDEPKFKAIQIILNSFGGSTNNGLMFVDFIEYSKMPVYVTGVGICASMGLIILCSGTKGHRIVTKNTVLLSHQYSWSTQGKYADLVADRKEQDLHQRRFIEHYKKHTDLTVKQIKEILLPHKDVWLTPQEAKKYGLIDKIIS